MMKLKCFVRGLDSGVWVCMCVCVHTHLNAYVLLSAKI